MTEPQYVFEKGRGEGEGDWYMYPETCKNWYMYPETCKNWNIIDCHGKDLKVGDVIPYGPAEYRYVLSVTPDGKATKVECVIFYHSGKVQDFHFTISSDLPFRCVARP